MIFCAIIIFLSMCDIRAIELKPHEQWWEVHAGKPYWWPDFNLWLNDFNALSRKKMRAHIQKKGYRSILDAASGIGTEYIGFLHDKISIYYQGIDISPRLVAFAQEKNINIIQASIEEIPFEDQSFDVSYERHALEHLPSYEKAVSELIRVARYEVIIVFFLPLSNKDDDKLHSMLFHGNLLYHHHMNKSKFLNFVKRNVRVQHAEWERCSARESILHVYMRNG